MAVVVVGGHTRNIGKTSVVAGLIAAMPQHSWTAIKITQFGHGICSADGKACECATADHSVAVSTETSTNNGTDTARYLAAGASRSLWVRTQQGRLFEAMPRIRREIASAGDALLESNSVLEFLQPDFFLSVLDPAIDDFKASARRYLDRADVVLVAANRPHTARWCAELRKLLAHVPLLRFSPPVYVSSELVSLVGRRLQELAKIETLPRGKPDLQATSAAGSGSLSR